MATISKRADSPYWWVAYTDGCRVRVSTHIHHGNAKQPPKDSPVFAYIRKIEDRLARRRLGLPATIEAKPIAAFLSEYVNGMQGIRETSRNQYRTLNGILTAWCSQAKIITVADIDYPTACRYLAENKGKKSLAGEISYFKTAWEEAKRRNYCDFDENPWKLKMARQVKVSKSAFSASDISTFLAADMPQWMRTMAMIALYTGARISSIKGLHWEHIGFDLSVINFEKSKTDAYTLPLHSKLADYLKPLAKKAGPVLPEDVLDKTASYISVMFIRLFERIEVVGTFHKFRHTFNSRLRMCGVEKGQAMLLMNHKSSAVNDKYTHVDTEDARALAPQIEKLNY